MIKKDSGFSQIDLKNPDKRDAAISKLRGLFPLEGDPKDQDFFVKNYLNLLMLHYFGIGVQKDPGDHDYYQLLMNSDGPYGKLPDQPGCKSPEFPEVK